MGRADRQSKPGSDADRARCDKLSRGALCVGEMAFAYFFADCDDDAFPADHGADAECESDRDEDPSGCVVGETAERFAFGFERFFLCIREAEMTFFDHFADGFVGEQKVLAELEAVVAWDVSYACSPLEEVVDLVEARDCFVGVRLRGSVVVVAYGDRDAFERLHRALHLRLAGVEVEREASGDETDQDQHHEADAFLPVVGAVREAHAAACRDEQASCALRGRAVFERRL